MWSVLGKVLNSKKSSQAHNIKEIISDGHCYKSDADIACALNNHFCSIGAKLSSKITKPSIDFESYLKDPIKNSFFLQMTNEAEVICEIQKLKTKKSAGDDGIKPSIIKASFLSIVKPLVHIYNTSFDTGVVPDIWKIAKVIPIFKNGERTDPANYRPISLLSCFEKIMERLMASRVISFLKKHKVMYELQFGFREGHSTIHALLELLDRVYSNLDTKNSCIGVFLDLSKAFDTIDHSVLLHKLSHYGFRGKIQNWFSSYLEDRKQYTYVNGKKSTLSIIPKGVPQGSVLGTILYTIYVNDMQYAATLKPRLFADDTSIFCFNKSTALASTIINSDLNKLSQWYAANKLLVNASKSNFCVFQPSMNPQSNTPKIIMGEELKRASEIKYLGVKIDEKLSWVPHISKVKNDIVKFSSIFAKLRYDIPKQCLLTLYDSLVASKIGYGLEVYGVAKNKDLKELQTLQNRILKIIYFKKHRFSTNRLHRELKILKISDLYQWKILKLMHNVHYNKHHLPEVFEQYFETNKNLHRYETRQKANYRIRKSNMRWGDYTVQNSGARLWNNLKTPLKSISNKKTFNCKVKENFIAAYFI